MKNLTIAVDEATLRRARIRALEQGTSVNTVLSEFLEAYAGSSSERDQAARVILDLSDSVESRHDGPRWTRDELHGR